MQLQDLAKELGYSEASGNWITLRGEERPAHHLLRAAKSAGVSGVYVFQTSPAADGIAQLSPRPAVYVAEAESVLQAREIRRRVWNLGNAPFLIVILPNQVRVYRAFSYDQADDSADLIHTALSAFHADEIDSGRIWAAQAAHLGTDARVDRRLLRNLNDLGNQLVIDRSVEARVAHALIGKYIYIRYLRDRGILDDKWLDENNLNLNQVLCRNATRDALFTLVEALESRFNGLIFPLPDNGVLDDRAVAFVASVFGGDEAESGQLALDFQVYDFSYIPIETMSLIYEQFLHREGTGEPTGAYYTPEPLADYLLSALNQAHPLLPGMTILDPCCGSGVFLVLAFRKLIAESMRQLGRELSVDELAALLQKSIYGVERNVDACYVAELSLLLTLLSYVDPPDLHRNKGFRFPKLHNTNIYVCDFFDPNSVFWQTGWRFDWVVGNPPWKELNPADKEESAREQAAIEWIREANRHGRPIARYRVQDAFAWHVTEALKPDGHAGLVTHATMLFNDHCAEFRREFFRAHAVASVTDFANLFEVLFEKRARVPAATLVYRIASEGIRKPPIVHYGPFAINQVPTLAMGHKGRRAWVLTVYENEIQMIDHIDAEKGESETWKFALWGTYRDRKAIARLNTLFPSTLGKIVKENGWHLCVGLQLRTKGAEDGVEYEPQLEHMKQLNAERMMKSACRLMIPPEFLEEIPEKLRYVREGRRHAFQIAKGPHLFLTIKFAAYSDIDFVLRDRRIGLAVPEWHADHLRALSLMLNSSVIRYSLFFNSSAWGVFVSQIDVGEAKAIPLPSLTASQISMLALRHRQMADTERGCGNALLRDGNSAQQAAIDEVVERVFEIPEDIGALAREFMRVRYEFNQGKVPSWAVAPPNTRDLWQYASKLAAELDRFAGRPHLVRIDCARDFILCEVRMADRKCDPIVVELDDDMSDSHQKLWNELVCERSQWVYVQRSLRFFTGDKVCLMKARRLIDWTDTQAVLDSDDIISEVLAGSWSGA